MRRQDHIDFYRNSAQRRASERHMRELRERAVRGEELSREVPRQVHEKPPLQRQIQFEDKKP